MSALHRYLWLAAHPAALPAEHVINVSGGKDSTAVYLLALERGRPFRAVFADTGHEHPKTYEFIQGLAAATGGPEVEIVRADFSKRMAHRRRHLAKRWRADGVPEARIERVTALMHPSGNPFLDMCILKGRFPSSQVRFCTEELKHRPIDEQVIRPALRARARVVRWQGERRDESPARAGLPIFQRVRVPEGVILIYRPIATWTAQDVFDLHARHGVEPNPLYKQGMGRVGCMPCIMARKGELREIGLRFPEEIARVEEWERLVAEASKWGAATFFAADKTPAGKALRAAGATSGFPGIRYVVHEWARTDRKGEVEEVDPDEGVMCSSQYGLCE